MDASNQHPKIVHDGLQVTRDPDRGRFDLRQHGTYIGFLGYTEDTVETPEGERRPVIRLQHTVIDEAYGRQGYARALVTMVLDRLKAEGEQIDPECSYVQDYLGRYPEYESMVHRG